MNIPIDIALPLPAPEGMLKILLVITFIVHILFVGLMVGGTYWSVIFKLLAKLPGREDPFYERLARETLSTVTVNKSIAVVLGVAPLLLIGLTYTRYWYTANMITVKAYLSIIWLVILAFWLLYAYKYLWDRLAEKPQIHLALGLGACVVFSIVPLIFLSNINLMLLPYKWEATRGFLDAILLANVLPRYLHFLVAICAMIGFFAAVYFWYRGRNTGDPFYERAQKIGLQWALTGTLLQGIFGTIVFLTLPEGAYSKSLIIHILLAIALAAVVCIVLIRTLQQPSGAGIITACVLLAVIALLMSVARHVVRENLLKEPHQVAQQRTREFQADLGAFLETYSPEAGVELTGDVLFRQYCGACHVSGKRLVGPSLEYMVEKYEGKRGDMISYVTNPIKVNPDYPKMPKPVAGATEIEKIVDHILSRKVFEAAEPKPGDQKPTQPDSTKSEPDGAELFDDYCSVCHEWDEESGGPPVTYMIEKYSGRPDDMVSFVKNPVKVNPDYDEMPEPDAGADEIETIVDYILAGEK
jgi:cytochrome c